jgi:hypothetical protein
VTGHSCEGMRNIGLAMFQRGGVLGLLMQVLLFLRRLAARHAN